MATNSLTTSADGITKLTAREALVDGLYDDSSNYATYGVGHLVHPTDKYKSFLLQSAQKAKLCDSRVKKQWPGTSYETLYLEREVISCADYEKLKTQAKEDAQNLIAQKQLKKNFAELSDAEKSGVQKSADESIDRETQLLSKPTNDVFAQDLKPYEKAVNDAVTGPELAQEEFDALVSFTFNVGMAALQGSTLLKKINEDKYRTGDAAARKKAIDEIEAAFLSWNKSAGKVVNGLTIRRQSEADQFLTKAREELKALPAVDAKQKGAMLLSPKSKQPLSSIAMRAVKGLRPSVPV